MSFLDVRFAVPSQFAFGSAQFTAGPSPFSGRFGPSTRHPLLDRLEIDGEHIRSPDRTHLSVSNDAYVGYNYVVPVLRVSPWLTVPRR